jgi:hypothetical protein
MRKDEDGGICNTREIERERDDKFFEILVGKVEEKTPFGKHVCRTEDNIKNLS